MSQVPERVRSRMGARLLHGGRMLVRTAASTRGPVLGFVAAERLYGSEAVDIAHELAEVDHFGPITSDSHAADTLRDLVGRLDVLVAGAGDLPLQASGLCWSVGEAAWRVAIANRNGHFALFSTSADTRGLRVLSRRSVVQLRDTSSWNAASPVARATVDFALGAHAVHLREQRLRNTAVAGSSQTSPIQKALRIRERAHRILLLDGSDATGDSARTTAACTCGWAAGSARAMVDDCARDWLAHRERVRIGREGGFGSPTVSGGLPT